MSNASAVERPSTFPIPNHPMIRTGTGIDLVKFGSATKEKKEKKDLGLNHPIRIRTSAN